MKLATFLSGVFGTVAFGLSLLAGLSAGNTVEVILTRGLLSAAVCYGVGYFVGVPHLQNRGGAGQTRGGGTSAERGRGGRERGGRDNVGPGGGGSREPVTKKSKIFALQIGSDTAEYPNTAVR
jgi:hypothetical protein